MKKLLSLLLIFPFFIACSSDDDDDTQDYTSFYIVNRSAVDLPNTIVAYKDGDIYKRLSVVGNVKTQSESDIYQISTNEELEVFVFTDNNGTIMADVKLKIHPFKNNPIVIPRGFLGIKVDDKTDPTQYPQ